jgi:hypothetical protein
MSPAKRNAPRDCKCGCREMTRGGEFRPGHDAKLRGKFLKRIDDGESAAIDEFLTDWPNLAYPYGYTESSLRDRPGRGVR